MFGGIFSEHWIDGQRCGPLQGAIAEKAVPFPSVARRSQFFLCSTRFTGVPSRPVQRDRGIASRAAGKAIGRSRRHARILRDGIRSSTYSLLGLFASRLTVRRRGCIQTLKVGTGGSAGIVHRSTRRAS
jgi:hypothetical protein